MNIQKIYESFYETYGTMGHLIAELSQGLKARAAERADRRALEADKASERVKNKKLKGALQTDAIRKARQAQRFRDSAKDDVEAESEKVNPKERTRGGDVVKDFRTGKPIQKTTQDDRRYSQNDQKARRAERQKKDDDVRAKGERIKKAVGYGYDSDTGPRALSRPRDEKSDKARYKKQFMGGGISRAEKARLLKRRKGNADIDSGQQFPAYGSELKKLKDKNDG